VKTSPKSLRLHIGIFGRTNVGKSSFLNLITGQDAAITSPMPGTTTDVVEKTMELLPIGPVVFLDTAGLDDSSLLGAVRLKKTHKVFDRSDIVVLLTEAQNWGSYEEQVIAEAGKRLIPVIAAVNKSDLRIPDREFLNMIKEKAGGVFVCSSLDIADRDKYIEALKRLILERCPDDFFNPPRFDRRLASSRRTGGSYRSDRLAGA